ncbi:MAG: hypothetical protein M3R38_22160 [Actinomycetota bacterium]|nr:hypothetical protein [Actinomycetota bacterium]
MGKFGKAVSGGRHKTVWNKREKAYKSLKRKMPVGMAARIANAGKTKAARSRMAKKAAATRKRRGR